MFSLSAILFAFNGAVLMPPWMIAFMWLVLLLPVVALFLLLAYLVNLPLKRRERARFFLDMLEQGIQSGRPVEQVIVELSQLKDPTFGLGFHYVASCLERGTPLFEALEEARGFLPPQMTNMLKAGAAIGDIRKVIPACRIMLEDGRSQFITGQNYLYATLFASSPASIVVLIGILTVILPKFKSIWGDMGVALSSLFTVLSEALPFFIAVQVIIVLALTGFALLYMGGPSFSAWLEAGFPRHGGWIRYHIPWQRRRMQRDFASILAVLLDANVPEFDSIKLAAACSNNSGFLARTNMALRQLSEGAKLPDAVLGVDSSGELGWRLANGGRDRDGFAASLRSWQESLDAKAFQQEQAFAQAFSAGLVAVNGLLVLATAVVVFLPMFTLLNEALLW